MPAAVAAFRKAADKGSTSAMVELGVMYAAGTGVPKNDAEARKYFERAAAAGNPQGATNLMTLSGSAGNASDPAQARAMLAKAADANSAEAQFQLGLMMAQGVGGPQDDVGARAMFEKAAAQNHPGALEWMGSFAANGRGGPKDQEAAKGYYERAAALGNEDAKAALERLKCPMVLTDQKGRAPQPSLLLGRAFPGDLGRRAAEPLRWTVLAFDAVCAVLAIVGQRLGFFTCRHDDRQSAPPLRRGKAPWRAFRR